MLTSADEHTHRSLNAVQNVQFIARPVGAIVRSLRLLHTVQPYNRILTQCVPAATTVVGVDNDTHDFLNAVPTAQYITWVLIRGLEFCSRCGHLSQHEERNACCDHRSNLSDARNLSYALLRQCGSVPTERVKPLFDGEYY